MGTVRRLLELGDPGPRERAFSARSLLGRRGIGKTRLLDEAMRGMEHAPPFLAVELPPGGRVNCLEELERQIQAASLGPLMEDMPADAGRRWATANPQGRFADILSHLMENGVIVCLDEFHNAREAYIESPLKLMIDHYTSLPSHGKKRPPGKLVITGSHQQHLLRMLRSDAPLFQRTTILTRLRQWPVSTVFEMAAEQGILARPGRFLTLWTAWGGLPRCWERLVTDLRYAQVLDPAAIPDDGEWRREFLRIERETLEEPMERFDSKAIVELSPDLRDALIWMSRRSARGGPAGEIAAAIGGRDPQTVHRALFDLEQHLELVRLHNPLFSGSNQWRISDNNTLFQLSVFRDLYEPDRPVSRGTAETGAPLTWLMNLEGPMLERLAADWLRERAEDGWVRSGVRFNNPQGGGEIDIAALLLQEDGMKLVLGECKRSAEAHAPGRTRSLFGDFMGSLASEGLQGQMLRADRTFRLLISRQFTTDQFQRLSHEGFQPFDIRRMARQSGIDPGPLYEPEKMAAGPAAAHVEPDLDDGPTFGM